MVLGFSSVILGLAASYFLYMYAWSFKESSTIKVGSFTLGIYLSLVTVLGFYIDFFGLPTTISTYFIIFAIFTLAGYYYFKPKIPKFEGKINNYTKYTLVLITAGFIYLAYPSFPSMFPIGSMPDAPRHYAIAQYIQEKGHLIHGSGGALSTFGSSVIDTYPFGTHLITVTLSSAFGIPLIRVIFPFHAFMLILSAAALYGIAVEYLNINEKSALLVPFFFLTSLHNLEALTYTNSFAMITGGFLATTFFWITLDYLDDRNVRKLLLLVLIVSAILMTYPTWAFIALSTFVLASVLHKGIEKEHLWVLVLGMLVLTVLYWRDKFTRGFSMLGEEGVIISNPYIATGLVTIAFSIFGIYSLGKKDRPLLAFLLVTATLPGLLFLYSRIISKVSLYWYYKTYYYLGYPLAIAAGAGVSEIYHKMKVHQTKNNESRRHLFLILLVVAGAVSLYHLEYIQEKRWVKQSITPDEYAAALKLREMPGDLFFMHPTKADKERPRIYWLVTLSQKNANPNGVLFVDDESEITPTHLTMFEVVHQEGQTMILQKRE